MDSTTAKKVYKTAKICLWGPQPHYGRQAGYPLLEPRYLFIGHLGPSWGRLGAFLGPLWAFLGPSWRHLSNFKTPSSEILTTSCCETSTASKVALCSENWTASFQKQGCGRSLRAANVNPENAKNEKT